MSSNNKNLIWGAIALIGIGVFLMGNNLFPSRQSSTPQHQTPGSIQWKP